MAAAAAAASDIPLVPPPCMIFIAAACAARFDIPREPPTAPRAPLTAAPVTPPFPINLAAVPDIPFDAMPDAAAAAVPLSLPEIRPLIRPLFAHGPVPVTADATAAPGTTVHATPTAAPCTALLLAISAAFCPALLAATSFALFMKPPNLLCFGAAESTTRPAATESA